MDTKYYYEYAQLTFKTARNKAAGKPVQNNTRMFEHEDGSFGVVLHGTEVVLIHPDHTYTLRSGGYHTVTTSDRIRRWSPAKLFSIRGEFYLWLAPNPKDPRPDRVERSIPKPYEASNPGPEPVKSPEGCVANQLVSTLHENEIVECWRKDVRAGEEIVEVISDGFEGPESDYDRVKVKRTWTDHVYVGTTQHGDDGWHELTKGSYYTTTWHNADGETVKYVQCSHCKEFDAEREAWRYAMHGERWGRRFDKQTGYATYAAMMEQFGSQEAWHEAYIADFRARRAYLEADKAWEERNRVPFYEGIKVDSEGYAFRLRAEGPSPAKLRRHEAAVKRMKAKIDKYVDGFVKELGKGTMPMPSGGDCWYCALSQDTGRITPTGGGLQPMGDNMPTVHEDGRTTMQANHDHLLHHIEERYYVPSLAVNALRERGYKDVGIYMWLDMDADAGTMGKKGGNYDVVRRDLRKYMAKRLVPAAPVS
jgi:hypothetical protein